MFIAPQNLDSDAITRKRKTAVRVYMLVSILQFISGIGSLACAGWGTHFREDGFPYYVGGFVNGAFVRLFTIYVVYTANLLVYLIL